MRKLILSLCVALGALILAPKPAMAYDLRVDGSWLTSPCYGCDGDKVQSEVLQQQADLDDAEVLVEQERSAVNLERALKLSLWSYDKAGHALELGDMASHAGNVAKAKEWYAQAVTFGDAALAVPDNAKFVNRKGENVPDKSHRLGARWKGIAQAKLAKLGS